MKLRTFITVGLTLAAIAVPVASADTDGTILSRASRAATSDSYIGHPGGPGAAGPVLRSTDVRIYPLLKTGEGFSFTAPSGWSTSPGSYLGHPGGPGGAGPIISIAPQTGDGFDWGDAAVGGGFVAGLALVGLGAAMTLRRRTTQAQLKF